MRKIPCVLSRLVYRLERLLAGWGDRLFALSHTPKEVLPAVLGRSEPVQDKFEEIAERAEKRERREKDIGETPSYPCKRCEGRGSFLKMEPGTLSGCRTLCPRCLGTGVQP